MGNRTFKTPVRAVAFATVLAFVAPAESARGVIGQGNIGVATILVHFEQDSSPPYPTERARVVLDRTGAFFRENSYGKLRLQPAIFGWYRISVKDGCDRDEIAEEADKAAAAAGIDLSPFARRLYLYPRSCSGRGHGASDNEWTTPVVRAWVGGSLNHMVVAHELGHTLGLGHAGLLDCGKVPLDSNGTCRHDEYGDPYDAMGGAAPFHFNALTKDRLGWVVAQEITVSGVYELAPIESDGPGIKAFKIVSNSGGQTSAYYLEHRRKQGFDSDLDDSTVIDGVLIHIAAKDDPDGRVKSALLNPSAGSPPRETGHGIGAGLAIGMTFVDPRRGITITPLRLQPNGIDVKVGFPP